MLLPFYYNLREKLKTDLIVVEYPGYSYFKHPVTNGRKEDSELTASTERINAIVDTLSGYIRNEMGYDEIYIYGRSIGTGPASKLASLC